MGKKVSKWVLYITASTKLAEKAAGRNKKQSREKKKQICNSWGSRV